jgi:hypothetical protein
MFERGGVMQRNIVPSKRFLRCVSFLSTTLSAGRQNHSRRVEARVEMVRPTSSGLFHALRVVSAAPEALGGDTG